MTRYQVEYTVPVVVVVDHDDDTGLMSIARVIVDDESTRLTEPLNVMDQEKWKPAPKRLARKLAAYTETMEQDTDAPDWGWPAWEFGF